MQEGRCRLEPQHIDTLLGAIDFISSLNGLAEDDFMSWLIAHETEVQNVVASVQGVCNATATSAIAATHSARPFRRRRKPILPPPACPNRRHPPSRPPPVAVSAVAPEAADRVVRVTAESLTHLMGLAGEALVQSRQLRPFVDSLMMLKRQHSALLDTLQILLDRADVTNGAGVVRELLTRAKSQAGQSRKL